MQAIADFLGGFWTPQTPVSFLAGVGAADLVRRGLEVLGFNQEEEDVQEAQ